MPTNQRATAWSVVINNPTNSDEECINQARQRGWRVEGQIEKGENGTPHYQLFVKTPQVRFSAVKKMFPRAHIDEARNEAALKQYVSKEETRIGELPTQSEFYPSLAKFWILFTNWYDDEKFPSGDSSYHPAPYGEAALSLLDEFVADIITKGYHVETMGVNPQIRSCVKNYLEAILVRSRNEEAAIHRQTDRQTDGENSSPE